MGIGCIITFLILGILFYISTKHELDDIFVISIACTAVLLIVGVGAWTIDTNDYLRHHRPDGYYTESMVSDTTLIKAAKLDSKINGNICGGAFAVSGFVRQDNVYKFYALSKDSTYYLKTVDATISKIKEKDSQPMVIEYYYTKGWLNHGWIWRFFKGGPNKEDVKVKDRIYNLIILPNGTIIENYKKVNL